MFTTGVYPSDWYLPQVQLTTRPPTLSATRLTDSPEPILKSPRRSSFTLPLIGEEADEEARLEREMTIEGAKLGAHTFLNKDAMMLAEPVALPTNRDGSPTT